MGLTRPRERRPASRREETTSDGAAARLPLGAWLATLATAPVVALAAALLRATQSGPDPVEDFLQLLPFALATCVGLLPAVALVAALANRVTAPLQILLAALAAAAGGALGATILVYALHAGAPPAGLALRVVGGVVLPALLAGALLATFQILRTGSAARPSEAERTAQLQALQSRIRPHFLFNSMNSIAGLLRHDPDRAERALTDLADVFRVLMADARKLVPISVEQEITRQYLEVEKLRLGDRLQVKWLYSKVPRTAQVPSLILQPLVENAVYHGIEPRFSGGLVKIEIWVEGDMLNLMVSNPVAEVASGHEHRQGNQIAMENIRERLSKHFGDRAMLRTVAQHGNFHAKISLPLQRA
ncbi:MAG: histidine kinase [Gammaproteobacteria bacterium]|nr:histidine kinase [Gammaproteobacteria bacterium]